MGIISGDSGTGYTASSMFYNYGASSASLDREIVNDIITVINSNVNYRPFSREGSSIQSIEGEANSAINFLIWRANIVAAISRYNASVPFLRQVVTSQELIDVYPGDSPEETVIKVYIYLAKNLGSDFDPTQIIIPVVF